MVLSFIIHQLKAALVFVINLIKRSLCCFRRRRKSSADSVPLTGIGIIPNYDPNSSQDVESWNTWEESGGGDRVPQTVQEHIEHYRRQAARTASLSRSESDEPQPDFFQDMEPEIKKPAKIVLKARDNVTDVSSRLAFVPDTFIPNDGAELGSWEETEAKKNSWAEAEGWDADGILREKRREEHKKRIMEKEYRRTLGARIS